MYVWLFECSLTVGVGGVWQQHVGRIEEGKQGGAECEGVVCESRGVKRSQDDACNMARSMQVVYVAVLGWQCAWVEGDHVRYAWAGGSWFVGYKAGDNHGAAAAEHEQQQQHQVHAIQIGCR